MSSDFEDDPYKTVDDDNVPSFQRDTISSFTSRVIARSMPKKAYDKRTEDTLTKACIIKVPRTYVDPETN